MGFATINKGMLLALALIAPVVSGCGGYRPAPKAFHEATIQPYRLDSGDRLRITVFEQTGLSNTYTIDQAGYVAFPLIGAVPAWPYSRGWGFSPMAFVLIILLILIVTGNI